MRRPWRSRPLRGIPAAPSWPPFLPQRAGCRQETPACGIVLLMWCGVVLGFVCLPAGREDYGPASGNFPPARRWQFQPVRAGGRVKGARASPLTIPAAVSRRCAFVTHSGLTDRPDAPSLAQPSSARHPCRS
ncbi:hypothetical protein, partial [Pantoea stewartii]|uniref:hypothetical protein n=1 Tax=Pantoea stewartii TaxID=66269 RepID=UPI00197E563D